MRACGCVQMLDMGDRQLIQRAWEQLVRESGPQITEVGWQWFVWA